MYVVAGSKCYSIRQKQQKHGTKIHEVACFPILILASTNGVAETDQPLLPLRRDRNRAASPLRLGRVASTNGLASSAESAADSQRSRCFTRSSGAARILLGGDRFYPEWILGIPAPASMGGCNRWELFRMSSGSAPGESHARAQAEREECASGKSGKSRYEHHIASATQEVDTLPAKIRRPAQRGAQKFDGARIPTSVIGETLMRMEMALLLESRGES